MLSAYDRASIARSFVRLLTLANTPQSTPQALYQPGLEGEALVKLACQCLRAGLERDCASGYGLVAYLVTPEGIRRTVVQGRMD